MKRKTDDLTAGELRSLVTVQQSVETPDGEGGRAHTWTDKFQAWFYAEQTSGGETYGDGASGRVRSVDSVRFLTWWRNDIATTDRLVLDGRPFNIRSINNLITRNKFLEVIAEAGVEQ